MHAANQGSFREQVRFLRRQFLQDGGLPFTTVLSEGVVARALNEELFLEYVTRVGAEIGTSINQEALARAVGGSEQ